MALDFGDAMRRVLDGGKMARSGWNGKGMWIALNNVTMGISEGDVLKLVCMKTAQGTLVPWLASVTDMVATDWEEVT